MPLHDLKCVDCAHEFEEELMIGAIGTQCPECGDLAKIHWKKAPGVFTGGDICDPFISHADGKTYSSKKKYRATLHARGFTEMGDERPRKTKFKPISLERELHEELTKIEEQ